jgi:chromosome segregation ATPase
MFQLKDRETKLQVLQEDVDTLQNKLRDIKEECAEKEGQMKVVTMNFSSVEKQRNHLADEVDKYEEALTQFKFNCDKVQQQYRDCHCALMQAEQQVLNYIISY